MAGGSIWRDVPDVQGSEAELLDEEQRAARRQAEHSDRLFAARWGETLGIRCHSSRRDPNPRWIVRSKF